MVTDSGQNITREANFQVWDGKYPTERLLFWGYLLPEYDHYPKLNCLFQILKLLVVGTS